MAPEIVSICCPCKTNTPKLCAYCTMKAFKQAAKTRTDISFVFSKESKTGYSAFDKKY